MPAPIGEVFAFFSRPENLSALTPPELGFVILTPPPIAMKEGALIDYTIRILGIRVRWTTVITSFEPGRSFVDEQLKGPYSYWRHTHTFEAAPGGTIVSDDIRYTLPFGPIGVLAHALAVRRKLEAIFGFRSEVVGRLFREGRSQGLPNPTDTTPVVASDTAAGRSAR